MDALATPLSGWKSGLANVKNQDVEAGAEGQR